MFSENYRLMHKFFNLKSFVYIVLKQSPTVTFFIQDSCVEPLITIGIGHTDITCGFKPTKVQLNTINKIDLNKTTKESIIYMPVF